MIFLKLAIALALMLFFSVFLSGGVATFMVIASYIIGHNGYALFEYGVRGKHIVMEYIAHIILTIFPNFSSINLRNSIHLDIPFDWNYLMIAIFLSLVYLAVVLFLAQWIFRRRSFDGV